MSTIGSSAQSGLGEWLLQRVTALYLAGFTLWLTVWLLLAAPPDYPAWKAWFSGGGVRLAFALAMISVLLHAWVGMRSVILDYVKPAWLRLVVQLLVAAMLLLQALWSAQILLVEALR